MAVGESTPEIVSTDSGEGNDAFVQLVPVLIGSDQGTLGEAFRRAARLVTVNDAYRKLTALRTVPEVCEAVYTQVKRIVDCSIFYMGLYGAERDDVEVKLMIDAGIRYPEFTLNASESLLGLTILSKQPLVRDVEDELDDLPGQHSRPRSVMFIPMLIAGRVLGVISAQSYKKHAYTYGDVQTVANLANQAAVAVENARLHEQARGWGSQLEVVRELGMELHRLESVEGIARSVVELIGAFLPFDAYRVLLLDEETQELIPIAVGATRPEYDVQNVFRRRIRLGEGILGWCAAAGESLVIGDAEAHPAAVFTPGSKRLDESMLVVPMRRDRRVLGVLSLSKIGLNQYTPEHLRLLKLYAEHAATAISNALLYETAQRSAEKLKDLDEVRKDFVSTVTHELRTPLTSVLGFTETLIHFWDRLSSDRQKDMVMKIDASTARLHRLVEDLLESSRVESGTLSLSLRSVEMAPQIGQAAVEITSKFRGQIITQEAPDVPVHVYADAHRVQQIVVNLLDNATKYSPEGSPVVIRWQQDGKFVEVQVQDFGPGIPEEARSHLFAKFGKVAQPTRPGQTGTGLGLYISRQLVEAMGGTMWVLSEVGRGSTFCFKLPVAA
jgi:K+-sensing histidine kinase KdpD